MKIGICPRRVPDTTAKIVIGASGVAIDEAGLKFVPNPYDEYAIEAALVEAQVMARKYRVPVVVEVILEKVTNIAMGTEIDKINEFEDIDCRHPEGRQGLELAGLLE